MGNVHYGWVLTLSFLILLLLGQGIERLGEGLTYFAWLHALELALLSFLYRKHTLLLGFLVFNFLFSLELLVAVYMGLPLVQALRQEHIPEIYFLGTLLFAFLFIPAPAAANAGKYLFEPHLDARWLVPPLLLTGFLLVAFAFTGEIAIGREYDAYLENIEETSGIVDYLLYLFIFIGLIKRDRGQNIAFVLLLVFYLAKTALLGFRVHSIMAVIALYALIYRRNLAPWKSLLLLAIGYVAATYLGYLKDGLTLAAEPDLSLFGLMDTRHGYFQSHHMGVITASSVVLDYLDSFPDALTSLGATILAGFAQPVALKPHLPWIYVDHWVRQMEPTPGGFYFPVGFLALYGLAGVVAAGALLSVLVRQSLAGGQERLPAVATLFITLFVLFPRWVSYEPIIFGLRPVIMVLASSLLLGAVIRVLDARARMRPDPSGGAA